MTMKKDIQTFVDIFNDLQADETIHPITKYVEAEDLFKQLDLALSDDALPDDEFNTTLKNLVLRTPKTASKRFFNQLFGGRQSKAVLGELLAVVLNSSMYTFKIGGAQIGVEQEILKQICSRINYPESSGGTFPVGGSMSNFMAMLMARDSCDETVKKDGVTRTLIAYTSVESHYSIAKNASFSGVGRNSIRYIPTDSTGRMKADLLSKQIDIDINKGLTPFLVNLTAGTTVLGVHDEINPIADVCEKFNIWLHVDGALGGAVIFSEKYKYLLDGIERSDSFAFNAHKMLGTPLSCSMIVVKDKKQLYDSFNSDADYLYQGDEDDLNPGKISLQCGRRNDALKFWTLWKSVGTKGLEKIVDHQFELAQQAHDYMKSNSDYTVYNQMPSIAICFNYKNIDPKKLCTALYHEQQLVVGYGAFTGDTFIRLVTINSNNENSDILNFFTVLEKFVEENLEALTFS